MPKRYILASFRNLEAIGPRVLPDRSILRGQKFVENAKIEILNCVKMYLVLRQKLHFWDSVRKNWKGFEKIDC